MNETRHQRIRREQAERKAAREQRFHAEMQAKAKADRRASKMERKHKRAAMQERRYNNALISDHNLDPGDDHPEPPEF